MTNNLEGGQNLSLSSELGGLISSEDAVRSIVKSSMKDVFIDPKAYLDTEKQYSLQSLYMEAGIPTKFADRQGKAETQRYVQILKQAIDNSLREIGLTTKWGYADLEDNDYLTFTSAERIFSIPESKQKISDTKIRHSDTITNGEGLRAKIARLLVPIK